MSDEIIPTRDRPLKKRETPAPVQIPNMTTSRSPRASLKSCGGRSGVSTAKCCRKCQ